MSASDPGRAGAPTGASLVAGHWEPGTGPIVHGVDPATGERLAPDFRMVDGTQLDRAAAAAAAAFEVSRRRGPAERAALLDAVADRIDALGDEVVERAARETGLDRGRLAGERDRTTRQLRFLAGDVRRGSVAGVRIDHGDAARRPAPRPDLRLRHVPIGPVAVFGSSNFPFAFSNAGGDTAAAFAAGCPVIVKVHSAHPGTAALVAGAVADAVAAVGLPPGMYSSLVGSGRELGQALVAHPAIAAVGFTGSRAAGLALLAAAQARPVPIPVFAEMSSINPVVVLPSALDGARAQGYVASLTQGAGQFCTNPGLLFVPTGGAGDAFLAEVGELVRATRGAPMLSTGIREEFIRERDLVAADPAVSELARGADGDGANAPAARLLGVDAAGFVAHPGLRREMFGPAGLVVRYGSIPELRAALASLDGQLTATLHAEAADDAVVADLLPVLERLAGRIVLNGWPTGVEVAHAMVHGGPWPATTDGRSTSVGSLAVARFQRPVSYQNVPDRLLPEELREADPAGMERRVDGAVTDGPSLAEASGGAGR